MRAEGGRFRTSPGSLWSVCAWFAGGRPSVRGGGNIEAVETLCGAPVQVWGWFGYRFSGSAGASKAQSVSVGKKDRVC